MKPQIKISDLATGEVIVREMNDEEYAQWEIDRIAAEVRIQIATEAKAKRQALLDKLGITEEEARLLLGGKN